MAEYPSYLIHYGVQGQKWGNRRYQNEDGSLTPEGREHYGYGSERDRKKLYKQAQKLDKYEYSSKPNGQFKVYRKMAKNKAIQEAIKDKTLVEKYNKAQNTEPKYHEPDFDVTLSEMQRKSKKDWSKATDEEWEAFGEKVRKQVDKEWARYNKMLPKDPHYKAWKEYFNERDRIAMEIAGEHAYDNWLDDNYADHIATVLLLAMDNNKHKK